MQVFQVYSLDDERYVGSATDLEVMPDVDASSPDDRLLFIRQGQGSAAVGLMTAGIRELNTAETTVTVPGTVRRARVFDDRVWIITDEQVIAYAVSEWRLSLRARIDVAGVRDIDSAGDNYVALVGTFGRANYRLLDDEHGPGGEVRHLDRQPGPVHRARFDGRHILVDCTDGFWLYDTLTNEAQPAGDDLASDDAAGCWNDE